MLFVLLVSFALFHSTGAACAWDNCNAASDDPNVIVAHLIPHTHDDLGWLKTVDQYFWGTHQDPTGVGVQYIYNTVIDQLTADSNKRFSFAETGFLWRWWITTNDAYRQNLVTLIQNGQIEMIDGGWVQNDEAAAHYVDIIDQMTVGLKHLSDTFGECGKPQVGWQVDPFGHSREMANLYAQMGYSSFFFARLHYIEKQDRLNNKTLEMLWKTSNEQDSQIFTGAFYKSDYYPPPGFCWDRFCGDEPICDNPDLEEYNVDQRVSDFVAYAKQQATAMRTNNTMMLMGGDFQYANAIQWFVNMDKLIKYTNANPSYGVKVIYSTPACYLKSVLAAKPTLEYKNDDFFPYASAQHSYWTGYFTSRPAFKGMIREASSILQQQKRLAALANLGKNTTLEMSMEASALCQHHDAVTGTAKNRVTKDYRKQLTKATSAAAGIINQFANARFPKSSATAPQQTLCPLANETRCEATRNVAKFSATVFNARGQQFSENVRIPYYSSQATVKDPSGTVVPVQVVPTFMTAQLDHEKETRAPYELVFTADVGPLGYSTYFVDNATTSQATPAHHEQILASGPITLSNEFLSLQFDSSGFLSKVTDLKTQTTRNLRQEFFYYEGADNTDPQPSGAYIFKPKSQYPKTFATVLKTEVIMGDLTQEVRQTASSWISSVVRLHKGANYIEFDWIVGPIPEEESLHPISKEVVVRYTTSIANNGNFYTDSNGRQMMSRMVNFNPSFQYDNAEPVAGNYYPIDNRIFLKDASSQLTVMPDRAEGGASLSNGAIEIMLHRRCFYDDYFGVNEALNERGDDLRGLVVKGTHTVHIGDVATAADVHRPLAAKVFQKPVISYSPNVDQDSYSQQFNTKYSGLTTSLPDWANLLSLEPFNDGTALLRFEHIYESSDGGQLGQPQSLDISNLFTDFTISSMNELLLGANRNSTSSTDLNMGYSAAVQTIALNPQQIRTYEVVLTKK